MISTLVSVATCRVWRGAGRQKGLAQEDGGGATVEDGNLGGQGGWRHLRRWSTEASNIAKPKNVERTRVRGSRGDAIFLICPTYNKTLVIT